MRLVWPESLVHVWAADVSDGVSEEAELSFAILCETHCAELSGPRFLKPVLG